jgi:hypothetical protein
VSRAACCRACLRRRSLGGGSQRGPSKSRGWLRHCNRTVEAMCKANWPAQGQPTEGEQAVPKTVTTRGLEGVPPRKEGVALRRRRGPGARINSAGDIAVHCKETCPHTSVRPRAPKIWVPTHLPIPGHQLSG